MRIALRNSIAAMPIRCAGFMTMLLLVGGDSEVAKGTLALLRGCGRRVVSTTRRPERVNSETLLLDLSAPLEWRAIVFQESFGSAVAVYQGTWIRQGAKDN